MKISQIIQETSTTAGSVAPVEHGFVKMKTRNPGVYGGNKVGNLLKGKKTSKPFANSVNESAEISETDLSEQDLIVVPGQGRLKKSGFVKHDPDKAEHEGETLKNSLHTIVRVASHLDKELSVRANFPEWVSEKIGSVKSDMVSVMDYIISSKEMQTDTDAMESLGTTGTMTNGEMGESKDRVDSLVTDALKIIRGSDFQIEPVRALKIVLGDREYNSRRGFYNFYVRQLMDMLSQEGLAEGEENKYGSQENWDSLRKDIRSQYPYKKGTTVTVPHKGKLVNGKIVCYEAGGGGYSPAYVVDIGEYESIMVEPNKVRRGVVEGKRNLKCVCKTHGTLQCPVHTPKDIDVLEGAKVDRMVKHVAKSEKKLGHSKKEAENIAWATANKRGMLDNKNKKK